jgi:hypothetical protein
MLNLMDPVSLEDLVLFRDDEDPRKFYLLPDQPVLSVDEKGVPDFYFIKYVYDATTHGDDQLGGGYVQFRTVLTIAQDRHDKVIAGLKQQLEEDKQAGKKPFGVAITATDPVLAAPLWTDGKVGLQTFKVGDKELVVKDTDTVPVDLAGSLGASVNLQLDPEGAEIFWASFKNFADQQIPILITYQLTYKARVSANMEIHADRTTIEQQLWQRAGPEPYYFHPQTARWVKLAHIEPLTRASLATLQTKNVNRVAAGILTDKVNDTIHSCVTDGTINVRIDVDEADAKDASGNSVQDMLLKVASDVLSGKVIPALFGDGDPPQPASDSDQNSAPTTGIRILPDLQTTAKFDISLTSNSTVERTCNPNGPIHVLIENPDAFAACFKELPPSDGFFAIMHVTASTTGIDFVQDGIRAIHVFIRYQQVDEMNPAKPKISQLYDGMLKADTDTLHFRFNLARDAQGGFKRDYEFRTDIYYANGEIVSHPDNWTSRTDQMLAINPAAMGAVRVELTLTAPRELVKAARVALQYKRSDGALLSETFDLTPDANRKSWLQPTGEIGKAGSAAIPLQYSYQAVYDIEGGQIAMPWQTSADQSLEIPGPFTSRLTFDLRPQGSFDGVANIAGDVTYNDAAHQYRIVRSFTLSKLGDVFELVVPAMDGGPQEVSYTARINRADGSAVDLAPGHGPAGTIWVGLPTLKIEVHPEGIDFDKDIELAVVHLSASDGSGAETTLTFTKASLGVQNWSMPVGTAGPHYDADVRFIAYDRSKNAEAQQKNLSDKQLILLLLR